MSHYDVLGVDPTADTATLRQAYLRLAQRHHPDRAGGDAARMQAINAAWATLGDPVRRARYDTSLRAPQVASASGPAMAPRPGGPRPGHEPDPRYDPTDDIHPDDFGERYAGWWEDAERRARPDLRPMPTNVVLPRWLRLIPMATFAGSVLALVLGMVFASEPILALSLMTFALSCLFFLAAPFMALLVSHRGR